MQNRTKTAKHYSKKANQVLKNAQAGREILGYGGYESLTSKQEKVIAKLLSRMIYGTEDNEHADKAIRLDCKDQSFNNCHNRILDLAHARLELFRLVGEQNGPRNQPQYSGDDYENLTIYGIKKSHLLQFFANETRVEQLLSSYIDPVELQAELNKIHNKISNNLDMPAAPWSTQTLLVSGVVGAMFLSFASYGVYMFGGAIAKSAAKITEKAVSPFASIGATLFGGSAAKVEKAKIEESAFIRLDISPNKSHTI
jgi:hypothetical protein